MNGTLQIKNPKKYNPIPNRKEHGDIIVNRIRTVTTYENGLKVERQIKKQVNVTKMVNETKKLIKQETASEKLAEIEKIFTK